MTVVTAAPLRLFVVSHTYTEPTNREKWRAFLEIAPGSQITIITPRGWHDPHFGYLTSPGEDAGGLRVLPLRTIGEGAGRHLFVAPALVAALRQAAPQVICVEAEPWSPVYLQMVLLRRYFAPAAVLAGFSWWNTPRWNTPLTFPGSWLYAMGRRATDLLIAGNRDASTLHRRHGFTGRVCVIPQLGVDPTTYAPAAKDAVLRARIGLRPGGFVVGFAGRLTRAKGVDLLIRAVVGLGPREWRLLIVGDGPEESRLHELSRSLGVGERVAFAGGVAREEMPRHLRLMDVLVLPSREEQWEQFGHVLIEAMACGVPVVGSTSGEIPGVIGDDARVFPMDDEAALRVRLARLIDDPGFAAACRARDLARARDVYSNRAVAQQLQRAFSSLGDVSTAPEELLHPGAAAG